MGIKFSKIKRPYGHIVSLGINCLPGIMLRMAKMKQSHLPLDWVLTNSTTTVADLLSNRFHGFMEQQNLKVLREEPAAGTYIVEDTAFNILSFHDFPLQLNTPANLYTYPQVKEDYRRRINRLYDIFETSEFILFIRFIATKDDIVYLKAVLDRVVKRPYYILVINNDKRNALKELKWGIDKVCSMSASIPHVNEKKRVADFTSILEGISISN